MIKFSQPSEKSKESLLEWLYNAFQELLDTLITSLNRISGSVKQNDRIGLVLTNDDFPDKPFHISFRRLDQLSASVILDRIEAVMQSNQNFFFNNKLVVRIDHVPMPIGYGGKQNVFGANFKSFCKTRKYGIIQYNQTIDNFCLAYALVCAKANVDVKYSLLNMLQSNRDVLKAKAMELCISAGVDLSSGGGLDEITKFQRYLKNYKIVVYNSRTGKTVLFEDNNIPWSTQRLNLLVEDEHFVAIKSLTATFAVSYYCEECHQGFSNRTAHKNCSYVCPCCLSRPPCDVKNLKKICHACGRNFRGDLCFNKHLKCICSKLKKCPTCFLTYTVGKSRHICNTVYCETCREYLNRDHKCYVQSYVTKRKDDQSYLFVYYDFECTQDTFFSDYTNKFIHLPNLCVINLVCTACKTDSDIENACNICGVREHIFSGRDCVSQFISYCLTQNNIKKYNKIVFIAHNMSGYDGHFILRHIYSNGGFGTPSIIMNGSKIISIKLGKKIKFIDSLNYFNCPLSSLPKMFQLSVSKGYYPHLFNTEDNFNYVGPLPNEKYFCPDSMSVKARQDFFNWYNELTSLNYVFNNKSELIKYCRLDVKILRKASEKFSNYFWNQNKIDCFLDASTIASACNKVFCSNYLEPDTIGIIPRQGYRFVDNQSFIGLKWLVWQEKLRGIIIEHAGRGIEKVLENGLKVDGFHAATNTVFEFFGCYFHGCQKCFPCHDISFEKSKVKLSQLASRREKTISKIEKLKVLGYKVCYIYECEFKQILQENPKIDDELSYSPLVANTPLNPRDAFFGGRTNGSKLYHKAAQNEKIHYYDIYSLYPFINKYYKYPIGHPTVYVGEEAENKNVSIIEGILKATILPPKKCLFPVLPCKMHKKLLFILCTKCAMELSQNSCTHTTAERAITGTWVVDEVREALKHGYEILKIHEVWEYKVAQYNKENQNGGLFAQYINKFLKMKAEASGWPSWVKNDELSKLLYTEMFEIREGVVLDSDNIDSNPGLRALAKLMLNSFWGKFGQRENMSQVCVLNSHEELVSKLANPSIETESYVVINDEKILLSYKSHTDSIKPLPHVNVAIAAYTTCGARLELYKYLELLGPRILYFDTDSIIFTQAEGESNPVTDEYLGEMTNELDSFGPESYISEFVCGGPKNYAFKVFCPINNDKYEVCKIKGITLNYQNSNFINFEKIKDMLFKNPADDVFINENKILRTNDSYIFSTKRKKRYNICYTKRRRLNDFDTLPYGWCD